MKVNWIIDSTGWAYQTVKEGIAGELKDSVHVENEKEGDVNFVFHPPDMEKVPLHKTIFRIGGKRIIGL